MPVILKRPAQHIIFDLDGVLLDTEPLYTRATQEIVGEFGKTFDWSLKANMIGRDSREGARYLIDALELPITPEEYLQRRTPLLEGMFPEVDPKPGAPDFVRELHGAQVRSAVATSAVRALTDLKLRRHGDWFSLFEHVVCGDDVERLKPEPDIFLLAAQLLGVPPESCVVVEDSPAGVDAAIAAGMQVVALPDPEMSDERYTHATAIVRSYQELSVAALGLR